jgi:4'-phosphopantetheinyl transferase
MSATRSTEWVRAVEPLTAHAALLSDHHVHVWGTSLAVTTPTRDFLTGLLSPDERERASRFHFNRDRDRYVAARGRLRLLLGAYAGLAPADLRFAYGAHGKPTLETSPAAARLRFNLSHSGDLAVYAVALGRDVGIDVERLRPVPEMEDIVRRWFPEEDRRRYAAGAGGDRVRAFFAAWTRREALVKARGEGLSAFGNAGVEGWAIATLEPAHGYVAALAVAGDEPAIRSWWAEPLE